jgi:hypothetical protein
VIATAVDPLRSIMRVTKIVCDTEAGIVPTGRLFTPDGRYLGMIGF